MKQIASLPSLTNTLHDCFGDRAAEMAQILAVMRERGLSFIIINLPVHYNNADRPNDLDLMLAPDDFSRAGDFLDQCGFLRLDMEPGPRQTVHVKYVPGAGFVRLHLHEDLWFFGLRLLRYDYAENCTAEFDGYRVAAPVLDYFVLHLEWFFRRKPHYLDRIRQLVPQVADIFLPQRRAELTGEYATLMQTLERLAHGQVDVTRALQFHVVRSSCGVPGGVIRHLCGRLRRKLRDRLPGPRRGKLIFFMGIDGTGKTTIAHRLVALNRTGGLEAHYRYLGLKETLLQRWRQSGTTNPEATRRWAERQSGIIDRVAACSILAANLLNVALSLAYAVDYWFRMLAIHRQLVWYQNLVVVDRAYYDKLGDHQRWGNKLFYHLLPAPDMIVALYGDLSELQRRKDEFDVPVLAHLQGKMDRAWEWLEAQNFRLVRVDTTSHDVQQSCDLIQRELWSLVTGESPIEEESAL